MTVKVQVNDLAMGMFIAELDRPWLDTPFLLQGFILDNEEDIAQIRRLCQFVLVDPANSTVAAVAKLSIPPPTKADLQPGSARTKNLIESLIITSDAGRTKKPSVSSGLGEKLNETATPKQTRRADPSIIYYKDTPPPPRRSLWEKVDAPIGYGEADSSALAEDLSDLKSHFTLRKAQNKRPGLFKQILSTLRSKHNEEDIAESASARPTAGVVQNKPLIRIADNKVVLDAALTEAKGIHLRSREMIRDVVEDLRRDHHINLDKVNEVVDAMVDSVGNNPDALLWLTKLKSRDSYAYDHGIDVAIYLLATGAIWQGVVLIAFGALIIGLVDNFLRPALIGKDTKMPDYVVLVSTIGGIALFGLNGFVIGPVIAAMFMAGWDIFAKAREDETVEPPLG